MKKYTLGPRKPRFTGRLLKDYPMLRGFHAKQARVSRRPETVNGLPYEQWAAANREAAKTKA